MAYNQSPCLKQLNICIFTLVRNMFTSESGPINKLKIQRQRLAKSQSANFQDISQD